MPNRHWDHASWYANPSKANQLLAWRATTSLDTGLKQTMAWMLAHPDLVDSAQRQSILHQQTK
jgi:dolichol-phosphate mannosyltransferase